MRTSSNPPSPSSEHTGDTNVMPKNCDGVLSDGDWGYVETRLRNALRELRFGNVEIQVHDGRIVRITRTEKIRLDESQQVNMRR